MSDQPLPSPEPKRERISDAEALFLEANKPKPKPKPKVKPADPAAIGQYEVQEIPLSRPEPRAPKPRPVQARSGEPRLPDPRGPEPRSAEPRAPEPRLPEVNPFDDPWGLQQDPVPKKPVRSRTASASAPVPIPEPVSRPAATKKPKATAAEPIATVEVVEEVWTRSGEWGMTILGMLIEAICGFAGVYYLLSIEEYGVAFAAMAASALLFAFLSYPLLITLERPVRITPEQAVKDFFDALSHHFPHYLRMWMLLSTSGKTSPYYASYDGFRRYWRENLIRFRKKKVSGLTPLKFQIQDFKSEKSAGKTSIDAVFTVRVLVRGRQAEGPIETLRVSMKLVKGPDRMWYLCKGTIR